MTSADITVTITDNVSTELVEAWMDDLRSCFGMFSGKDIEVIGDLY